MKTELSEFVKKLWIDFGEIPTWPIFDLQAEVAHLVERQLPKL